ncbi:hypothetical protein LSAT2_025741, partial [Lamellibrachia satsuma]
MTVNPVTTPKTYRKTPRRVLMLKRPFPRPTSCDNNAHTELPRRSENTTARSDACNGLFHASRLSPESPAATTIGPACRRSRGALKTDRFSHMRRRLGSSP